jgi:phosphoglycolate phosphatase-like HAD superfamily hydrolase
MTGIVATPLLRSPKAILFDLDGTLVDSAPDIAAATNELLATSAPSPLPAFRFPLPISTRPMTT